MAREIHFADRMSAADALMWNIESDPHLRSTITKHSRSLYDRSSSHYIVIHPCINIAFNQSKFYQFCIIEL